MATMARLGSSAASPLRSLTICSCGSFSHLIGNGLPSTDTVSVLSSELTRSALISEPMFTQTLIFLPDLAASAIMALTASRALALSGAPAVAVAAGAAGVSDDETYRADKLSSIAQKIAEQCFARTM